MPFFITLQQSYQSDPPSIVLATASLHSPFQDLPQSPKAQPSSSIVPCTHLSTMYHHPPIASSSHSTIHDSWTLRNIHSYPTSDLRSSPLRRHRIAVPTLSQPPQSSMASSCTTDQPANKYSITFRREVEPGVWSDGTDRVLSAAYPAVQDFLATARRTLSLPLPPSELVFVIAALEVFYCWNDPVHWMFWSDEKKVATAAIVNRIARTCNSSCYPLYCTYDESLVRTPQLIRSKVAWNGEAQYLFILSSLHGASSLPVDKDWFHVLNPKASSSTSTTMNLRKRKAPQIEQTEVLGEEDVSEIEGARPKRPKTRSTRVLKPASPVTPENTKPTTKSSLSDANRPSTPCDISASPQDDTTPSNHDISLSIKSKSSRQGPTARQASSTSDPLSISRAGAASLAPAVVGLDTPAPSYTRNRNRSISQTSSQTTLVADERRSLSVLSTITAVEVDTGKGDDKGNADQHPSDSEKEKEKEEGMVTRGRANKARTPVTQDKGVARPNKRRARRTTTKSS
ncbi:hypothetical protein C0991_001656 [Blastosporella zonata]|nr:hypothetical protein C0991_001656 [Blastosporella zonata]